jgi:hypothetical protein
MLTHQPQSLLVLRGRAVLEPEHAVRLDRPRERGRLDGCHPVVRVVEQRQLLAEALPDCLEHPGQVAHVGGRVPGLDRWQRRAAGRLVVVAGS